MSKVLLTIEQVRFIWLDGFAVPTPAQVTQAVGLTMDIETILWLILAAIMLPSIGVGLSAMACGKSRVGRRPPSHPPGWKNR